MSLTDDREHLLRAPRQDLDRARHHQSDWAELAYAPAEDEQGQAYDRNRATRFGVLWALQYDRRPGDLPLLRFLLAQETRRYRQTEPMGIAPDLELAGFLLAEHRQAEDVWLHWRAKTSNFDTAVGYHTELLLTAGVEATLAFVRASEHPQRDRVLTELTRPGKNGSPHFTDTLVEDCLAAQRTQFPADPAAENLRTWANHAARLGEREISRRFLLAWAQDQPQTEKTLNTLQSSLARLGFHAEAIEAQRQAIALTDPGWERASKLLSLAERHRESGEFVPALAALRRCADDMPVDGHWKESGLWRHFVREHFLLVPMAPDQATARELLAEGDRRLTGVSKLWQDGVLVAALAAVEHTGDERLRARYLELQQAEHR